MTETRGEERRSMLCCGIFNNQCRIEVYALVFSLLCDM